MKTKFTHKFIFIFFLVFLSLSCNRSKDTQGLEIKRAKCEVRVIGEAVEAHRVAKVSLRPIILEKLKKIKKEEITKCIKNFNKDTDRITSLNKKYTKFFLDCTIKNFEKDFPIIEKICNKTSKHN